jgi:colicin import membrane protein
MVDLADAISSNRLGIVGIPAEGYPVTAEQAQALLLTYDKWQRARNNVVGEDGMTDAQRAKQEREAAGVAKKAEREAAKLAKAAEKEAKAGERAAAKAEAERQKEEQRAARQAERDAKNANAAAEREAKRVAAEAAKAARAAEREAAKAAKAAEKAAGGEETPELEAPTPNRESRRNRANGAGAEKPAEVAAV